MPGIPWASEAQVIFLKTQLSQFAKHQNAKTLPIFWSKINGDFFEQWPDMKSEAESLTDKDRKTLKPVTGLTEEQWIAVRIKSIYNWYNNNSLTKPSRRRKGNGVKITIPRSATRLSTEAHLYSKRYYDTRVKPFVDAEVGDRKLKRAQRIAIVNKHLTECFKNESAEIREEIKKAREEDRLAKEVAQGIDTAVIQANEELTLDQKLIAQSSLPDVLADFCDQMGRRTGWSFAIMAGGPDAGDEAGEITTISVHTGQDKYGQTFRKAYKDYKSVVEIPFSTHLSAVYAKAARDKLKASTVPAPAASDATTPIPARSAAPIPDAPVAGPASPAPDVPVAPAAPAHTPAPAPVPALAQVALAAPSAATQVAPVAASASTPVAPVAPAAPAGTPTPTPVPALAQVALAAPAAATQVAPVAASASTPVAPVAPVNAAAASTQVAPIIPAAAAPTLIPPPTPYTPLAAAQEPVSHSMIHSAIEKAIAIPAITDTDPTKENTNPFVAMQNSSTFGNGQGCAANVLQPSFGGNFGFSYQNQIPEYSFGGDQNGFDFVGTSPDLNVFDAFLRDFGMSDQMFTEMGAEQGQQGFMNGLRQYQVPADIPNPGSGTLGPSLYLPTSFPNTASGTFGAALYTQPHASNVPVTPAIFNPMAPTAAPTVPIEPSNTPEVATHILPSPAGATTTESATDKVDPPAMTLANTNSMVQGAEAQAGVRGARTRKPPASKEIIPLVTKAAKEPEWIAATLKYLKGDPSSAAWEELVNVWFKFETESALLDGPSQRLSPKNRPATLSKWLTNRRQLNTMPEIDDVAAFGIEWRTWWNTMQPKWRQVAASGTLPQPVSAAKNSEDLSSIQKAGPVGLIVAIISLKWWAGDGTNVEWVKAVEDIKASLEVMLAPTPKLKRRMDSEGNVSEKRKKV